MSNVQNPTIPTPTQAKGIDAVILDLQTHLDTELSWLTNGMGRAYQLSKVRTNQTTVILPEVYLGGDRFKYFAATPDNDKQAQNIFFVGTGTYPNEQLGFYGILEYEVALIFSANLDLYDNTLTPTEDATEHLMEDVREAIIRDLLGKAYKVVIGSETRQFDEVYAEFDVTEDRGIAHMPMTHFRFNLTIQLREDCAGVSLDRCTAILQNISTDEKNNCILPTYDFSSLIVQAATTAQQQADMVAWLCGGSFSNVYSMNFNAVNQYIDCNNYPSIDFTNTSTFTFGGWVRSTSWASTRMIMGKRSGTGVGYNIFSNGGKLRVVLRAGVTSNAVIIDSQATLTDNVWYQVYITYDGSGSSTGTIMYIDGAVAPVTVIQSNTTNTLSNTNSFEIGASNGAFYWGGDIDLVRVWNIVLTPTEISSEYNGRVPQSPVQNTSLVLENNMGESATFDSTSWRFPDASETLIAGYNSVLMTLASRTTSTPL